MVVSLRLATDASIVHLAASKWSSVPFDVLVNDVRLRVVQWDFRIDYATGEDRLVLQKEDVQNAETTADTRTAINWPFYKAIDGLCKKVRHFYFDVIAAAFDVKLDFVPRRPHAIVFAAAVALRSVQKLHAYFDVECDTKKNGDDDVDDSDTDLMCQAVAVTEALQRAGRSVTLSYLPLTCSEGLIQQLHCRFSADVGVAVVLDQKLFFLPGVEAMQHPQAVDLNHAAGGTKAVCIEDVVLCPTSFLVFNLRQTKKKFHLTLFNSQALSVLKDGFKCQPFFGPSTDCSLDLRVEVDRRQYDAFLRRKRCDKKMKKKAKNRFPYEGLSREDLIRLLIVAKENK